MKKNAIRVVAVLSLAALTNLAYAVIPGVYVGGGLGYSNLETPTNLISDLRTGISYKKFQRIGGIGEKVFAGYNLNPYFGIEAGFANYAQSKYQLTTSSPIKSDATATVSLYSGNLVGKAYLPFGDTGFNLYGLGGGAYVRSTQHVTGTQGNKTVTPLNVTTQKIRPVYGAGMHYDIPNTQLAAEVEYSRIQGMGNVRTDSKAIPSANLVTFNLAYNFG